MVAKRTIQPVDVSFLEEKDRYLSSIPEYERTSTNLRRESAASKILQEEGIGSAKDILSGMQIPSARSIVESEFGTTPTTTPPTTTPEIDQTKTLLEQKKPEPPKADQKTLDAIKEIETKIQTVQALKPKTPIEMEEKSNLPFYQEQLAGLKDKAAKDASMKETFQQKMDRAAAKGVPYYTYFNETDYADYEAKQNADYKAKKDKEEALFKEQAKQQADQLAEDELLRKEQEFINNFKFNGNAQQGNIESPKYGTLNFSDKQVAIGEVRNTRKENVSWYDNWQSRKNADLAKLKQEKEAAFKQAEADAAAQGFHFNQSFVNFDYNKKLRELENKYKEEWWQRHDDILKNPDKEYDNDTPYTYTLTSTVGNKKQNYVFLPESYIINGANGPGGYHYNTAFLDQNTWKTLTESSQPINLEGANLKVGETALGRGFLFTTEDWNKFKKNNLEGKFYANSYNSYYMPDRPIIGIGSVNGELKYIRQAGYTLGKDTVNFAYINKDGSAYASYTTKEGGVKGFAQDIAKSFAEIPFGAEFIGIATGNPALYASLKGLQTAGMGGDVGDVFKSMAVGYATATVATNLGGYGEALGKELAVTLNIPTAVANAAGGAIVGAAFNGTMAAVTGGDVEKAMLAGAIGGGAQATAAEFTNAVMGGEANVQAMASAVNLDVKQFQQIFTGAIASGAIAESVYGRDFMDAFSTSLVTQGVSTAAANTVAKNLDKTMSPAARKTVVQGTQMYVAAAARAAVRGEDMATAIKNSTPEYIARLSGAAIRESTRKST